MNDSAWQTAVTPNGPAWLTLSFVLIGVGVLIALAILIWGTRLARRRSRVRETLKARDQVAEVPASAAPKDVGTTAVVTPADATLSAPPPIDTPAGAGRATPPDADMDPLLETPEPAPAMDLPPALERAAAEDAPAPDPLRDEPVAAAAPLAASPAALAGASGAGPAPARPLTALKGVGPKVAERLGALGVTGIDQLAALSPEEAAALDAQLGAFQGRMARDRWVEQARLLAAGDTAGYEAAFGKL
jgi:predicted flap endonuclease-1-like 5' DNA nuclease